MGKSFPLVPDAGGGRPSPRELHGPGPCLLPQHGHRPHPLPLSVDGRFHDRPGSGILYLGIATFSIRLPMQRPELTCHTPGPSGHPVLPGRAGRPSRAS